MIWRPGYAGNSGKTSLSGNHRNLPILKGEQLSGFSIVFNPRKMNNLHGKEWYSSCSEAPPESQVVSEARLSFGRTYQIIAGTFAVSDAGKRVPKAVGVVAVGVDGTRVEDKASGHDEKN